MPGRIIANAYFGSGMSVSRRTAPGRRVNIRGGHAAIVSEKDLAYVLRMPDAKVHIEPDWVEWLPEIVNMLGQDKPVTATINGLDMSALGRHKEACMCGMCLRVRVQRAVKERLAGKNDSADKEPNWKPPVPSAA